MADVIFHSMEDSAYLWAVMHVADEKGVPYDFVPLAYRSPEHLAMHPFGKMPVLQHGDYVLYESLAIAHYLDRAFPGPALQPSDARGQAEVLRWISIVNAYVFPIMNRFMKERLVKPLYGGKGDATFIADAREPLHQQMALIDHTVTANGCLAGREITLADSFLLPHLLFFRFTPEGSALIARHAGARAWLERMMARPSFTGSRMAKAHEAFKQIPAPKEMAWEVA
jgi:glutathione S-transferase